MPIRASLRAAARFARGRPPCGVSLRVLPGATPPPPPESVTVLSWNIHYGYGPRYDTGRVLEKSAIEAYLREISRTVRETGADIVALQEVDPRSWRVHDLDQLAWLQDALGLPWAAFTPTWDVPWVPSPGADPRRQWGRARSGQATLSRFPLSGLTRHALPQPPGNGALYNRFYLHRAALEATVDLGRGGRGLRTLNVHTEAFDRENCSEHARILAALVQTAALPDTILLGDLNSVPPEATLRHAFPDEPETDMRQDRVLDILRGVPGLHEVVNQVDYLANEPAWFSFPAWEPNRRLDYLFHGEGLKLRAAEILRPEPAASDHLPVLARFALG